MKFQLYEISIALKKVNWSQNNSFFLILNSDVVFILLINIEMPTIELLAFKIVSILTFMSRKNFILNWGEHEKRPGCKP